MATTMTMNEAGIVEKVAEARASFRSGRTRPSSWRRAQLEALKSLLKKEESRICEALWADLRKPRLEAHLNRGRLRDQRDRRRRSSTSTGG